MPLTICDTQTSVEHDYGVREFRYVDRVIETFMGGYSPSQRWYYFPDMSRNEAILLKTHDSQGQMYFTADRENNNNIGTYLYDQPPIPSTSALHTAVRDPRVPADTPPRESVEVRCMVFF